MCLTKHPNGLYVPNYHLNRHVELYGGDPETVAAMRTTRKYTKRPKKDTPDTPGGGGGAGGAGGGGGAPRVYTPLPGASKRVVAEIVNV